MAGLAAIRGQGDKGKNRIVPGGSHGWTLAHIFVVSQFCWRRPKIGYFPLGISSTNPTVTSCDRIASLPSPMPNGVGSRR